MKHYKPMQIVICYFENNSDVILASVSPSDNIGTPNWWDVE